jgi:hypothetical protein
MKTRALLLSITVFLAACATNGELRTVNDPFKGTVRGFALYLDPGHYTAVDMAQVKGELTLGVLVVQRGVADYAAKPGDKAQFRVGDKLMTLHNIDEAKPVANATRYQMFTQWVVHFKLTPAEAAAFAAAPLTDVLVSIGDLSFQMRLDEAQAAKFRENMVVLTAAR